MPRALITGASRANSIAATVTSRLRSEGWQVFTSDLDAVDYPCDLAERESPERLIRQVVSDHGPLDALILSHAHGVSSGVSTRRPRASTDTRPSTRGHHCC